MKRLVLVLVLALVLVGSASAEPLATYQHTFEFSGSGSGGSGGSGSGIFTPTGEYLYGFLGMNEVIFNIDNLNPYLSYGTFCYDYQELVGFSGPWLDGNRLIQYDSPENSLDITSYNGSSMLVYHYMRAKYQQDSGSGTDLNGRFISMIKDVISELCTLNPGSYVLCSQIINNPGNLYIFVLPYGSSVNPSVSLSVDMVSEVQEPWFDLFGMRGLSASFTPSNPDEDYYILFAGSDSWVADNPDKWVWTRVHGSTDKYKIIFSGNSYTWFVKYNDEIQEYSFTYTGEEGFVSPDIVPNPDSEPPVRPPIIDSPGDIDPDIPSMPDLESPDLTLDFTSGFDDYENMTIYQDIRNMIDGFTSTIAPNIQTTQLYQSLQQVIAYLQLVMEQLQEKYAVPIYNILASVSSFVPPICWLAVDIAVIFGMFRFVVHIVTGPISSAIRERF